MTPRPNSQLTNWFLPVLALTEMIAAAPYAEVQARDATSVGVQLLYPHSETTWWAGQWHNITWDPCSLSDDMEDTTPGTFYLLNEETLCDPVKLVENASWSTDRVVLQEPLPAVREDSGYRIGLVFGNTSIDGKACDVDMSCSAPFTIMDGTDKSDYDE